MSEVKQRKNRQHPEAFKQDAVTLSYRIGVTKVEAIHGERFATRQELRQTIFKYIEVDYNRHRRHSAANYLPPMVFEQQFDKVS